MTNTQNNNGNNTQTSLDVLLDQGLANRLTVVIGSDASKRSKALNQWLARRNYPVLQIEGPEGNDGDGCLRSIIERFAEAGLLDPQTVSEMSTADCQHALVTLINRLAQLDRDLLIVISDYEPCDRGDQVLTFLLEHLPNQVHLYVCSEDLPGFSCIPRLRVRRQLQMIDTNDD
ncbi:MAG TPA: hypothetical protein VKZ96_00455 [Thermomicrobiales bacterium]|nr:hypothetical protein [Thermomicrobiales bacterium]